MFTSKMKATHDALRHRDLQWHNRLSPVQAELGILLLDGGEVERQRFDVLAGLGCHRQAKLFVLFAWIRLVIHIGGPAEDDRPLVGVWNGPDAVVPAGSAIPLIMTG